MADRIANGRLGEAEAEDRFWAGAGGVRRGAGAARGRALDCLAGGAHEPSSGQLGPAAGD
jgi:hypothetical protein